MRTCTKSRFKSRCGRFEDWIRDSASDLPRESIRLRGRPSAWRARRPCSASGPSDRPRPRRKPGGARPGSDSSFSPPVLVFFPLWFTGWGAQHAYSVLVCFWGHGCRVTRLIFFFPTFTFSPAMEWPTPHSRLPPGHSSATPTVMFLVRVTPPKKRDFWLAKRSAARVLLGCCLEFGCRGHMEWLSISSTNSVSMRI